MKKIKKIAASIMAVAAMATSMVGISASASTTNSYSIWLERYAGAPSGAGSFSQSWNYTTTGTTIDFDIDTFYRSTGASYSSVNCVAYVNNALKLDVDVYYAQDPLQATVVKGKNGTASVELKNYNSGTHRVVGNFHF